MRKIKSQHNGDRINRLLWRVVLVVLLLDFSFLYGCNLPKDSLTTKNNYTKVSKLDNREEPIQLNRKNHSQLIIIKSIPSQKVEEIMLGSVENNIFRLETNNSINVTSPFDRAFRYINSKNELVFIQSHQKNSGKKFAKHIMSSEHYPPGNFDVFFNTMNLRTGDIKQFTFYRSNNWLFGRGYESERPPEFYISTNERDIILISLVFSGFQPAFYLLDLQYKGWGPNDFAGNVTEEKLYDLPLNPLFKNEKAAYLLNKENAFSLYTFPLNRHITPEEVRNWEIIVKSLKEYKKSRPISEIWKFLDEKTKNAIDKYDLGDSIDNKLKDTVLEGLNKLILSKKIDLTNSDLFADKNARIKKTGRFQLRPQVKMASNVRGNNVKNSTIHRYFLESAFPGAIIQSGQSEEIVSNHQIYEIQKGLGIRILHKCWSPDDKEILFVGALEKDWHANVYTVDVESKKTEKLLEKDDASRNFNPDLEWTENGMVITCKDAIYVRDVKTWQGKEEKVDENKVQKLDIPSGITNMRNGRISPDGDKLMFFGIRNKAVYLFIYNLKTNGLMEKELGRDTNMENYQGAWIYPGKMSIIKNQYEYQRFRGLEDLRK